MSDAYEPFLIPVEVIGGKDAESTLKNIDSRLKEISEDLLNVGHGGKEVDVFTKEMKVLASVTKSVASALAALNKVNAQAAKDAESVALAHQKVATEAGKTARELEKAKTQTAATAVANQKLSTELQNTAAANARAELAALRVAQAHEKEEKALQKEAEKAAQAAERKAQALAKMAEKAAQAAAPYNILNRALREQATKLKNAIAEGGRNEHTIGLMADKYKRLKDELDTTNAKFNALTGSIKQTRTAGMAFASFLGNLAANVIQRVISSLGSMVQEISKAGVALDGITNTFAAGARGWKQGGEEMEWVAKTAETLGLNIQSTYEPYAKFMTSFTRSGGTLQESRQIFEDLSTAMVSLHLTSDQMNNVFVALEQMANKGTVQAEELKRQLGNALPGAFELAAQSMSLTTAELMDMMKKGQVVSREFLPNFAALVKDSLGTQIGIAVNQYNAHMNRLKSQTFLLQANMGQILNEALTPFVQGLTAIMKATNLLIKSFGNATIAATAIQAAFVALGVVIGAHIVKMSAATVASVELALAEGKITPALAMFQKSLIGINSLLTTNITKAGLATAASNALKTAWSALAAHPIGAALIAVGAAALYCTNSINKANKEIAEQYVQIQDVTNNVTGLISEYSQLSKISNKTSAQQEAYNRSLDELSNQYPTVLEYMKENKIDLQNLTKEQAENIASLAVVQKTQDAEMAKLQELSNGWIIFGTRLKQVGKGIILVVQAIEAGIAHAVIALGQIFTRTASVIMKSYEWVYDKLAKGAELIGQKELAATFRRAESVAKGYADSLWDIGKDAHANLNGAIKSIAKEIEEVEIGRIQKAERNFKDSLATIGQEQTKLAQQLMYSSNNLGAVATGEHGKKSGAGSSAKDRKKEAETEWDNLNKLISKQEEEIKVLKLTGQENKNLEESYAKNLQKRKEIEAYVNKITAAGEGEVSMWKRLKKAADDANSTYENRLSNSLQYTDAQIEEARQNAKSYNAIVKYAEAQKNANGILQITSRTAKQLTNDLVDGLFTPLQEGETIWSRFKDAGVSAIKAIATEWVKNKINMMLTGFQGGWAMGTQGGGTLGQKFLMGMIGANQGAKNQPLLGTANNQAFGGVAAIATPYQNFLNQMGGFTNASNAVNNSAFNTMSQGAMQLANTLTNSTNPAVGATTNAVMGVANPAVMAANAVATMATAAPIAATSMGALGTIMTTASAGFTAAAPALVTMGAAMSKIAASAAKAATSMAAYAVAAAAASVASIPIVGAVLAPVAALATGAAIAAGTALTGAAIGAGAMLAGGGQMIGGVMSGIGTKFSGISLGKGASVVPHAKGGIVSSPTMFPMQGGNVGLAGEAGTEVIAPARRMSNGDIGIGAVQPKVIVNNYTNAAVEVKRRPDDSMEIKIAELNAMLSSSRTNKGMTNAQSRMQKKGRQIG